MYNKYMHYFRLGLIFFLLLATIFLLYTFFVLRPSNTLNWGTGYERVTQIVSENNQFKFSNVRDNRYEPGKTVSTDYTERSIDPTMISNVWFLFEPFSKNRAIAHTYFVFDIEGQEPIALSVEARTTQGEKYNAIYGAFNKYELIYLWGSEKDLTIRRPLIEKTDLYMFPLKISDQGKQNLFLQMVARTQSLENTPRFYNTLTSNCTNELAKSANAVKPNAIPYDKAFILPGYSVELLYKLGFIQNDISVGEVMQKYFISDKVKELYNAPDFSQQLRQSLR